MGFNSSGSDTGFRDTYLTALPFLQAAYNAVNSNGRIGDILSGLAGGYFSGRMGADYLREADRLAQLEYEDKETKRAREKLMEQATDEWYNSLPEDQRNMAMAMGGAQNFYNYQLNKEQKDIDRDYKTRYLDLYAQSINKSGGGGGGGAAGGGGTLIPVKVGTKTFLIDNKTRQFIDPATITGGNVSNPLVFPGKRNKTPKAEAPAVSPQVPASGNNKPVSFPLPETDFLDQVRGMFPANPDPTLADAQQAVSPTIGSMVARGEDIAAANPNFRTAAAAVSPAEPQVNPLISYLDSRSRPAEQQVSAGKSNIPGMGVYSAIVDGNPADVTGQYDAINRQVIDANTGTAYPVAVRNNNYANTYAPEELPGIAKRVNEWGSTLNRFAPAANAAQVKRDLADKLARKQGYTPRTMEKAAQNAKAFDTGQLGKFGINIDPGQLNPAQQEKYYEILQTLPEGLEGFNRLPKNQQIEMLRQLESSDDAYEKELQKYRQQLEQPQNNGSVPLTLGGPLNTLGLLLNGAKSLLSDEKETAEAAILDAQLDKLMSRSQVLNAARNATGGTPQPAAFTEQPAAEPPQAGQSEQGNGIRERLGQDASQAEIDQLNDYLGAPAPLVDPVDRRDVKQGRFVPGTVYNTMTGKVARDADGDPVNEENYDPDQLLQMFEDGTPTEIPMPDGTKMSVLVSADGKYMTPRYNFGAEEQDNSMFTDVFRSMLRNTDRVAEVMGMKPVIYQSLYRDKNGKMQLNEELRFSGAKPAGWDIGRELTGPQALVSWLQKAGGTWATDLAPLIKQLTGQQGAMALKALREASKNGASGYGNLTEKELNTLENLLVNLGRENSWEDFTRNLSTIRAYLIKGGVGQDTERFRLSMGA